MVSNKELETLSNQLYHDEVLSELGIDINNLKTSNYNIKLKDCNSCSHRWKFMDSGLSEKNLALYLNCLNEDGIDNYCVGKGFYSKHFKDHTGEYIICFETNAVDTIESAVRKADLIKAIFSAAYSTQLEVQKVQSHRKFKRKEIENIFTKKVKKSISNRKRMWHEIDEGIRRFLGKKPKDCQKYVLSRGKYGRIGDCVMFAIHGDELRDLLQSNSYAVDTNGNDIKADLIMFGHYHLQMIMIRYNTIILLTGCFTSDRIGYRGEFISHLGAPIFFAGKKISQVCVLRLIPMEEDYNSSIKI